MSSLSIDTDGHELTVWIHADLGNTPWWMDTKLVQYEDGRVFVTWDDTRRCNLSVLTFARFQSFDEAWDDPRLRRTLAPYLVQLGQTLPTRERIDEALNPFPVTREARRRIEGVLKGLDEGDYRKRREAREKLKHEAPADLRDARSHRLSVAQRAALGSAEDAGRVKLSEGQWALVEGVEW